MEFTATIEAVGKGIEVVGVAAIVLGLAFATAQFAVAIARRADRTDSYEGYRRALGRAILLGLEFLVAADIIRTVAIEPTFRSVGVLAVIILVRTFLSFTLQLETTGRWPWQPAPAPATGRAR